uniref:Transmembrane protein 61 n=1 Tax=Geotrypetes seraphini TaxID=260995 RepID=A0A6P8NKJ0_GEOSA|nr:transmembrane protein 61 [Geotrypetes seraphini]XP_033771090.1 transmembrane protein 61 [Geotrypetes seraphini]XP_033771091.1 transmembrane protein 61 [Geotrypetes seraphini]XP_033771092.1 transmembrane protein 61 [Geotrypetes seraphini]
MPGMTSSMRYGVTITGTVLLVTGTLCFAWWSDGEVEPFPANNSQTAPGRESQALRTSPSALLRSISFFCCGVGGFLLLFGLLWSVKVNAGPVSRRYQYHHPGALHYVSTKPCKKITNSHMDAGAGPAREEVMNCSLAYRAQCLAAPRAAKEEDVPPTYRAFSEDTGASGRKRSLSDSALLRSTRPGAEPAMATDASAMYATPPPSYETLHL